MKSEWREKEKICFSNYVFPLQQLCVVVFVSGVGLPLGSSGVVFVAFMAGCCIMFYMSTQQDED